MLGLKSLSRQNSVLEMSKGNEYLTLPGPGGYTVNRSPGTVRYKLERSISGHLILPCDEFNKVTKNSGGVEEPRMTFFGQAPKTTCTIGTQTEPEQIPRMNPNRKQPKVS